MPEPMQTHTIVRIAGVAGAHAAYAIYAANSGINGPVHLPIAGTVHPLVIVIGAIVALVSPETIDRLPFGPSK